MINIHRLSSDWLPKKMSVRFQILPILAMAMVMLAVACGSSDGDEIVRFSEKDVDSWRTQEISLLDPDDSPGARIFSVKLPIGWDIRHARPRTESWSGQLVGKDFTLDFQGGPMAMSVLDEIVGRGDAALDEQKAAAHLITEEAADEGIARTLIRPQDGGNGVTGMIMDLDDTQLLIAGREMSTDQQAIAFAVFRTITQ